MFSNRVINLTKNVHNIGEKTLWKDTGDLNE